MLVRNLWKANVSCIVTGMWQCLPGMLEHVLSSLSVGNNSLCPFQIPSRKAIADICGTLTLPVPAVLPVFGGLLMEHHPKDSQEP